MSKIKTLWGKFKKVKHFEIILAVLIGIVVCLIYFGFCNKPKSDKSVDISTENSSSAVAYVDKLENKLSNVLAQIDGVGKVKVAISLESGFCYEYATDTETKTTVSGDNQTTITTETVILVSNEPVVIKEIYPVIKGVVIVAEGANNVSVKMNILTAVETILEIDRNKISILA